QDLCLGVQGNLWAETLNDSEELEYQLLPRLMALAEIGWRPASQKNWMDFLMRMQPHGAILDSLNYTYAKHFFFEEEKTAQQTAIAEAERVLKLSKPGKVGYASQEAYDALTAALATAKGAAESDEATQTLNTAIETFKTAPIVQPVEGKAYQIVSASTYYSQQYNGSTLYEKDGSARFHYTPQVEPEEVWTFVKSGDGFVIKNYMTGNTIALPTYNQNVTVTADASTPIRIDNTRVKSTLRGATDFIPGAVLISAVDGYTAEATGNVARLWANKDGYIKSFNDPTVAYQGTWRIEEIEDFKAQLQGLVNKAERIVENGTTGDYNEPTEEALAYLNTEVVEAGKKAIEAGLVSEETYKKAVAAYEEYLGMPRKQIYDALDENAVYTINCTYSSWSARTYATANNGEVKPAALTSGEPKQLWYIKKMDGGKIKLYNKATNQAA
ncbi:MAG: family 20 glycosylhydrolase, partial [Rothia sp. (in: high G+C Gram-positive bacteria)]|uniref:family 20 glycosylhydrolase n=1 Tax=Rothia sp. (in: high G+C Gram-positive bacteria) TaxID=1885016 RepID=UPI0026DEFAD2